MLKSITAICMLHAKTRLEALIARVSRVITATVGFVKTLMNVKTPTYVQQTQTVPTGKLSDYQTVLQIGEL